MNHEQREHSRSVYFTAACYASTLLGADASKRFDELRRLSHSDDLDSLKKQIDRWSVSDRLTTVRAGAGTKSSFTPVDYQRYAGRCVEHGGDGSRCPTCIAVRKSSELRRQAQQAELAQKATDAIGSRELSELESAKFAAEQKARMELVSGWYKQYGKWIVARVNAELPKYTELTGAAYTELKREMVALCWAAINQQCDDYEDEGLKHGAMAWLKRVVFGTVANHFRDQFRKCRDVRKEDPLSDDDILVSPWEPMEARPTRPAGDGADEFEEDRAEAYRGAASR